MCIRDRYEEERYDEALKKWESAKRKERLSLLGLNTVQALIISVAMTLTMWLAALGVADNTMTIGDFVLINAFMMQLFLPLNFLGFVYREIRGSTANIENMFALLDVTSHINEVTNAPDLKISQGAVSFQSVSFGYGPDRPILKALDFTIQAGKQVAIVGASGAGTVSYTHLRAHET